MANDTRRTELFKIFEGIDEHERELITPLVEEVAFLEAQMTELRKLPFIRVHPRDPSLMKSTPAAKQYKECSQSYMNAVRILLGVLNKAEVSAQDELLKRLEEFA